MTQDEARHLRDAAILILYAVNNDLGANDVSAALRNLPDPIAVGGERERLLAAREILEQEQVWRSAVRAPHE